MTANENNMTVEQAASLMGVSPQYIRAGLQQERLPFGYAVKVSARRYTYFISRNKFMEFTGITF